MTNDVENVLRKIEHYHQGSIAGFHIMYRDPMRFWDGIQWDGKCALFFSLRETDEGAQMNPKGKAEFASLLVNWRTKHGWNREESAAKLDVPHRTLQEWEQGRRKPSKMAQRGVVSRMEEIEASLKQR